VSRLYHRLQASEVGYPFRVFGRAQVIDTGAAFVLGVVDVQQRVGTGGFLVAGSFHAHRLHRA
jgi:hypothetical protein